MAKKFDVAALKEAFSKLSPEEQAEVREAVGDEEHTLTLKDLIKRVTELEGKKETPPKKSLFEILIGG